MVLTRFEAGLQPEKPMNVKQANRLLDVAYALRDYALQHPRKAKKWFTMQMYTHLEHCGTPGCALGHYAARGDLQSVLTIADKRIGWVGALDEQVFIDDPRLWQHFGIDIDEGVELFGRHGCGKATTCEEAADYIEGFVRKKGWNVR